ncbi:unnamed protein product [Protopolystoma xenopodis]|uniref:Uncharacterized protein n=1 Tax=Protopolystoma xenopodis TaxID=117903 RepID=A0A3S5CMU6_9PLAT|nr:unnamed protein product [Protopolystoma xenopodis]
MEEKAVEVKEVRDDAGLQAAQRRAERAEQENKRIKERCRHLEKELAEVNSLRSNLRSESDKVSMVQDFASDMLCSCAILFERIAGLVC